MSENSPKGREILSTLSVDGQTYHYFSLQEAAQQIGDLSLLPISLKILLENALRFSAKETPLSEAARAIAGWMDKATSTHEIPFRPSRILMQDLTGVPAVVDLAAMRDGIVQLGGDPKRVNPLIPVDLVIDHSVMVDVAGTKDALAQNVAIEFSRNKERYGFLRWGQKAFENFRVVPPGAGICHQVNLEYLAQAVWTATKNGVTYAYPDTLFGTDSHTTMVNGIGVLGWGVGGIEAEAAMLGQATTMVVPDVFGVVLEGELREGVTATDLVLTLTELLRREGVVGKFVEFCGEALDHLPVADRATIANMAPEYGATCGFFPIDARTLAYLTQTGRDAHRVRLVEAYARAQGLFRDADTPRPRFSETLCFDLSCVVPCVAGPKRPQDRVSLSEAPQNFLKAASQNLNVSEQALQQRVSVPGKPWTMGHGDIVIAAITSCTNTSNPAVLIAAGLLARKARAFGLRSKPWVKTSLAPGSQVVTDYLDRVGLSSDLDALGFETVGYGCTTCIGNSGPLSDAISSTVKDNALVVGAVLSGNRNFEGRISPLVKANYLASPPLVIAYALLGSLNQDISTASFGLKPDGSTIRLSDLWPSDAEVHALVNAYVTRDSFIKRYHDIGEGTAHWQALASAGESTTFAWSEASTYVQKPPFFDSLPLSPEPIQPIEKARILALLGDNVTTDHISPAGAIEASSPAGQYLQAHDVAVSAFNSYGSRRGNDRVMVRGTFANIRIKNEMLDGVEGGFSYHISDGKIAPIYDVAQRYVREGVPLIIVGGKEYGMGSSRDWAAKGTRLLGVKAVIAESFERIHRANLVGMGVLALTFLDGVTRQSLKLDGRERISLSDFEPLIPRKTVTAFIERDDGSSEKIELLCRIDTFDEIDYYRHGGILPYVLRGMTCAD